MKILHKVLRQVEVRVQRALGKGYVPSLDREIGIALRALRAAPQTVIDGGGNVGGWSAALLTRISPTRLILVEPDPGNAEQCRARFRSQPVTVVEAALSNSSGEAQLFANYEGSVLGSLHRRDLRALGLDFDRHVTVKTMTIADMMQTQGIDYVDLLKLDIEGHELAALSAAPLDRIGAIQFEFGGADIDSRTHFRDFWTLLSPAFDIFRISPVGLVPVAGYREHDETFVITNYICTRH